MKSIQILFISFTLLISSAFAQELTLDQILEKHFNAMGFDKLEKTNTIIMSGYITRQDYMPIKIYKMRPDKYKMEFDIQDITAYQSYDGKTAWMTTPWTGNTQPQIMSEDASKDIKSKADYDGVLYHYKEKEHKAELIGKDTLNNQEVYKIKLTRKDGGVEFYFIDTKDFLLLKKTTTRISRGKEVEIVSLFSDYRNVQDIKFAYWNENLMGGQPYSIIEFDLIEIDKPMDEKIFSMPN